ncbi:anti-phage dCTP deaminase [Citrobacter portucalensis]|uniref:anti-phage dCTP deaminase n=1 Tax=Citrobacter portucalensis TaxID=1639133 RepID=UPI00186634E5|nr:deoxycytidylate deaminase [Citrobacter freundii]EJD6668328.1 deoxycytidylate deaminase [Citrobacter freundii]MBQ0207017.1 deoxycytidylate deaminase [Citrobacter freundii]
MKNKKFVSELFLENGQFILVGLTGRTGSGCTTTANILEDEKTIFPDVSKLQGFYKGLDVHRYNIVKNFTEKHWENFYSIKVSDLISVYLLTLTVEEASEFIFSSKNSISKQHLDLVLTGGVFSDNLLSKKFKNVIDHLLNHDSDLKLDDRTINKVISILKLVRKFTKQFKAELNEINSNLYVSAYQLAGKSIRRRGCIEVDFESNEFIPKSVFHLPETINRVIKLIRKNKRDKALIVIDAIRNPYEAKFFKDRYSAFHLISINAPDEHRTNYLRKLHKFSSEQIEEIDTVESGKGDNSYKHLTNPNVTKCIELSDIHIFNPKNEFDNDNILKAQLAWYVALMKHPGLITPTAMERVMQVAYTVKLNSGCISRQVGAVVTDDDNSIKAVGWNDVANGQIPCSMRSLDGLMYDFDEKIYSHYERNNSSFRNQAKGKLLTFRMIDSAGDVYRGRNLSYCFKDIHNSLDKDKKGNQVHTRALHAEENAFLQLAKYGGVGILGGKLYTTASPCELCAKKAYQLGVSEIIFIDPYPGIAQDHIINIGSKSPILIQFRGAIGKSYHRLYEQVIPIKDELDYLLE